MEPLRKIDVPLQELRGQKPVKVQCNYIELYPDCLRWVAEFEAEEYQLDDEGEEMTSLPMETVANFYDIIAFKRAISGISTEFCKLNRLFKTTILCTGFTSDINVYFKSKSKALALKDELLEWVG